MAFHAPGRHPVVQHPVAEPTPPVLPETVTLRLDALAHPVRLRLLRTPARGPHTTGELAHGWSRPDGAGHGPAGGHPAEPNREAGEAVGVVRTAASAAHGVPPSVRLTLPKSAEPTGIDPTSSRLRRPLATTSALRLRLPRVVCVPSAEKDARRRGPSCTCPRPSCCGPRLSREKGVGARRQRQHVPLVRHGAARGKVPSEEGAEAFVRRPALRPTHLTLRSGSGRPPG